MQPNNWGLSWSYDRYGNRLSQTVTKGSAPSLVLGVDSQSNRVTGWAYDRAGHTLNDGSHSYAFDANNRMTSLDGGSTLYRYDAGGQRIQKVTATQTTSYFFGVGEYVSGLGLSKLYIKLGEEKLVEYSGSTTLFFHADHRFTLRVRTDVSGTPNQTWDDLPFGEEWQATGFGSDQHRLSGHMRDSESGNEYAGVRYYSSMHGRWKSVDPAVPGLSNPQRFNLYSYVLNDPINFFDPTGSTEEPIQGPHTEIEVFASPPGQPTGLSPWEEMASGAYGRWFQSLTFELWLTVPQLGPGAVPQLSFDDLLAVAIDELFLKLDVEQLSADCQRLFDALGVNVNDYLDKLANANKVDALGDTRVVQNLSQNAAFQHWWPLYAAANSLNVGITVQDVFNQNSGLNAWTLAWDIQTIFLRGSGAVSAARLGHEVFHLFGRVDSDIQERWFGPSGVSPNTTNITQEFQNRCL